VAGFLSDSRLLQRREGFLPSLLTQVFTGVGGDDQCFFPALQSEVAHCWQLQSAALLPLHSCFPCNIYPVPTPWHWQPPPPLKDNWGWWRCFKEELPPPPPCHWSLVPEHCSIVCGGTRGSSCLIVQGGRSQSPQREQPGTVYTGRRCRPLTWAQSVCFMFLLDYAAVISKSKWDFIRVHWGAQWYEVLIIIYQCCFNSAPAKPRHSFAYHHLLLHRIFQTLNLKQLFSYISEPYKNEFFPSPPPWTLQFFCGNLYSHDARVLLNFLPSSSQT